MELRDYLSAIRRRWWWLPAACGLALGLAVLFTLQATPQYATYATFFIGTPNRGITDAYQGSLFSQERVKSYATMLAGDRIAAAVSNHPGIGLSSDEIRQRITAQPVPQTVLLEVTVTDGSKVRSKLIADVLAREFTQMIESLETPTAAASQASGRSGDSTIKVEVVAGPRLDPTPVSPRPVRNLGLGALLGLLAGIGLALLREVTDNSVKSGEALRALTGAPVLATIPHDSGVPKKPLINGRRTHSARAEALRKLRTNLQFVDVDRPVRVIVVTSAVPSEGKSSTSVNLAVVFADAGQRVLVIDADLRRPKVAEYLGIEGAVGLTNLLAGQALPDDAIQRWSPRLWALPSGFPPPNPSELLASRQMADLLKTFRERFDIVIIDSPPLLAVTDAAVLAACADGALLVARAAKTSNSQVSAAVRALDAVSARLLGCAFNMVAGVKSDSYGDYYCYNQDQTSAPSHGLTRLVAKGALGQPVQNTAVKPVSGSAIVEHAAAAATKPSVAEVAKDKAAAGDTASATPVK